MTQTTVPVQRGGHDVYAEKCTILQLPPVTADTVDPSTRRAGLVRYSKRAMIPHNEETRSHVRLRTRCQQLRGITAMVFSSSCLVRVARGFSFRAFESLVLHGLSCQRLFSFQIKRDAIRPRSRSKRMTEPSDDPLSTSARECNTGVVPGSARIYGPSYINNNVNHSGGSSNNNMNHDPLSRSNSGGNNNLSRTNSNNHTSLSRSSSNNSSSNNSNDHLTNNNNNNSDTVINIRRGSRSSNASSDERQCWVCLATEDDDREAEWTQPCKCKGATKWVHQRCIQRWIDEKQAGSCSVTVACPQCNSDYVVIYPRLRRFVFVLDAVDRLVFRVSPFVAAGVVMGSIYWSAVTFGAVTVLQVLGYKEGLKYMEASDPFFLLVGLPTIPTGLLLAKMVPWEECCLRLWLQRSSGLKQFLNRMTGLPAGASVPRVSPTESLMNSPGFGDAMNATRLICSALLLPTISTLLGKLLFPNIRSGVQRAFLAAIVFSVVKGLLKIYLRKEQYIRQAKRKVMDFESTTTTPTSDDSGVHQV